jgi:hypothetical protein
MRREFRDWTLVEKDLALIRLKEPGDEVQGRRLPGAARPQERDELAGLDLKRDRIERYVITKPLPYSAERECGTR